MDLYESPKSAWEGESKSNKQKTLEGEVTFFNFHFWHDSQLFPNCQSTIMIYAYSITLSDNY